MKTSTPDEKTMLAGEEERSEKPAWQRPVLKVFPLTGARGGLASIPDGGMAGS